MERRRRRTDHDPREGVGPDGAIVTGASRVHLAGAFMPVLEAARERLGLDAGDRSLYVYGSVATGTARRVESDVDLVTIGVDAALAKSVAAELTSMFSSLCRSVEIGAAELSDHEGPGDEAYGNRVFLRHYCVHWAGPDPGSALPRFPADRAAARGFNGDIGRRASRWQTELSGTDPTLLGRRIARKTLFAVAGLVSVHDAVWTTDRVAAAHRWSVLNPRLADDLATLVSWGDGPPAGVSRPEIQRALDGLVADIVDAFRDRIGLWAETRVASRGPA